LTLALLSRTIPYAISEGLGKLLLLVLVSTTKGLLSDRSVLLSEIW
jgi:hypothetical protein